MPYLHWETDRSRFRTAEIIKEVSKHQVSTMSEVVDQQLANMHPQNEAGVANRAEQAPSGPQPGLPLTKRKALGQLLWSAATLLEAMEYHVEEQMIAKYVHAEAPLHPRRTLDQFYYGALKDTGARDRDQVVYRATTPEAHDCDGFATCPQCNEDVRQVSRLIMVDQLWLWILDESEKTPVSSSSPPFLPSLGCNCRLVAIGKPSQATNTKTLLQTR